MDGVEEPDSFERQTVHIQRWVRRQSVPTIPLASELLAWAYFCMEGLDAKDWVTVMSNATDLLRELYDD